MDYHDEIGRPSSTPRHPQHHPSPLTPTMSSPSPTPLTPTSTLPLRTTPPVSIPVLGFGIYKSPPSQCVRSVQKALSVGYRHIDSAQFYGNEAEMGEAVRRSGIPRAEVFLTTKIMSPGGSPEKTYQKCVESVRRISRGTGRMDERGTKEDGEGEEEGRKEKETEGKEAKEAKEDDEYVDLFLIHSSSGGPAARKEMWLALERLLSQGKTRAIGVSNYGVGHIEEMKAYATVWPPHVNQIEVNTASLPPFFSTQFSFTNQTP